MITAGVDVHKRTHTFVTVDDGGRQLAVLTVPATTAGHHKAVRWACAQSCGESLRWAVVDCRNMSARLERDLLAADQLVVRVAPQLMAEHRAIGRQRGKSDPIDALAVARAAVREPDLPTAHHDQTSKEAKLLVDHRDGLIAHRTAQINRLRWHLHDLDPEFTVADRALGSSTQQQRVQDWLTDRPGLVAELARELITDITAVTTKIAAYTRRITTLTRDHAQHLHAIPGCGPLTAAKILGETANITRFATSDKYARYAGIAPVPVWSGNTRGKVRLTRSGNRQLNAAIHRIAITQIRLPDSLGRAYYDKKQAEGKTRTEALRCLKRQLLRTIYNALRHDHHTPTTTTH